MRSPKLKLAIALLSIAGLSACNEGYGYSGVSAGYGVSSWDPYYGGYSGDPYWGWNGDSYYPGTGGYVYDRRNVRRRLDTQQRGYWQGRSQRWRGDGREMRPMWRDYGVQGHVQGGRQGFGHGGGQGRAGRPRR